MSKDEQYNCQNWIEFSGIPNTIKDNKLEETIIKAYKDVNNVSEMDIEVCHILPIRCYATNISKRVIVRFANQKHAESILSQKFNLRSMDFSTLNIKSLCQTVLMSILLILMGMV